MIAPSAAVWLIGVQSTLTKCNQRNESQGTHYNNCKETQSWKEHRATFIHKSPPHIKWYDITASEKLDILYSHIAIHSQSRSFESNPMFTALIDGICLVSENTNLTTPSGLHRTCRELEESSYHACLLYSPLKPQYDLHVAILSWLRTTMTMQWSTPFWYACNVMHAVMLIFISSLLLFTCCMQA